MSPAKDTSFKHYCTCGGYAYGMTERSMSRHPHTEWCPQREEWEQWKADQENETNGKVS
jgi:hypothetical protein